MKKLNLDNLPKKHWLDYSSLSDLMRCPRLYWWVYRNHVKSVNNAALVNGEAYHECKATYHKKILEGLTHESAKKIALACMVPIMKKIRKEDKKRNLTVALETMNYYLEFWYNSEYKTYEDFIEVGFAINFESFIFAGKIDRIVTSPLGLMVEETKSTTVVGTRWQYRTKPNLQIDGYVSGFFINTSKMPDGAVLDIIPVHEDSRKRQDPFRYTTMRTEADVEEWVDNIQEWWITIERYENDKVWPKNTDNCQPLTGWSCGVFDLCKKYPNPHKIKGEIEVNEEQYLIEPWAPFEVLLEG